MNKHEPILSPILLRDSFVCPYNVYLRNYDRNHRGAWLALSADHVTSGKSPSAAPPDLPDGGTQQYVVGVVAPCEQVFQCPAPERRVMEDK